MSLILAQFYSYLTSRYFDHDRTKSWEQNQHGNFSFISSFDNLSQSISSSAVSTFNTVEDFWSLFTHIKQPSEVNVGSDYSLFKENIRPMWEDKGNKNGGRWMLTLSRSMRAELDRYWIDTVRTKGSIENVIVNNFFLIGTLSDW